MKKEIAIIMAIIMTVSFAACNKQSDSLDKQTGSSEVSSENHTDNTEDIEKPSADMIYGVVNGTELLAENKNNTTEKQNIGSSNNNNETAGDKNNSAKNNSDSPANKPKNKNNSSNIKPNKPNSSNNNTGNNKPTETPTESTNPGKPETSTESTNPGKPEQPTESTNPGKPEQPTEPTNPVEPEQPTEPTNPVKPTEPDETTTPPQHEHNWSSGWLDTEIAKDESGNAVSLHLCAKCYEYFGSTSGDEWIGRYWDHCDTVHEAGYTTWPLYAYYDAEWCPECDTMNRGKFAFYGYCDYSVSNEVSTRKLESWQVEELNLPLK